MLPLDLHVLSLPLAFILSQDQTLRCIKLFNLALPLVILSQMNLIKWIFTNPFNAFQILVSQLIFSFCQLFKELIP